MTRLLALTSLLAAATGCGVSYDRNVEPVFTRSCAAVECHSGDPADESGLDLSEGNGYGQIVGQPSEQSDLNLVEPGDPDASYLWHKVNGTHIPFTNDEFGDTGTESEAMPPVGALGVTELATIEDWILEGAPE